MKIKNWLSATKNTKIKYKDITYKVKSSRKIVQEDKLGTYVFLEMDDPTGDFCFFAKIVDDNIDVRIYTPITWIQPGDRANLINTGNQKFFQPPQDVNNFVPNDLEWTESFDLTIDGNNVPFNKKYTMYGVATESPKRSGIGDTFTAVTEFAAVVDVPNPEIIILELGGINPNGDDLPNGGLIVPFEGYRIENDDVESVGWFGW
jgi:hypothetical protein